MFAIHKGTSVALLALVSGGAVYGNVLSGPRGQFRQFFSLGQNGHVSVDNRYGDVSIVAWDRDEVLVEAVKQAPDSRRMDEARIVVEPSAGSLSIRTQYAGLPEEHPAKVQYRITVPRSTSLDDVKLGNGGLTICGVSGPVKASSVNGGIKAQSLEGRTELSTVNGPVEADFGGTSPAQPILLRSINGAIRLLLPQDAHASLSARNVSGGIESDFGHTSRIDGAQQLFVRGAGAKIRLDNVNGGISIHSTWSRHGRTEL